MKRIIAAGLAVLSLCALTACKKTEEAEQTEVIVFAAASMTETLTAIAEDYKEIAPNVTLVFNFDSSGTLQTQIEEGADCDVFVSAAAKQMNALEEGGFLLDTSRVDLLENRVVLVRAADADATVTSFEDVLSAESIALGNSDVPVGQYAQEIFENMGIWDDVQEIATFGSNVKEVTTWVDEGAVQIGVVYETDANAAGLTVIADAPSEYLNTRVIYPACLLKNSAQAEAAQAFLDYLATAAATSIFEAAGFVKP